MDRYEGYNKLVAMGPVKTVDELINRIEAEHMPIYQMRFFINEDRKEPRCFGIYFDHSINRWIVYKNKADGSRAIRIQTCDEAAAAQEIWLKILSEIKLRLDKGQGPVWRSNYPDVAPPDRGAATSTGSRLEESIREAAEAMTFSDGVATVAELENLMRRQQNVNNLSFNENRRIPGRLGIYRKDDNWIVYKNDESGTPDTLYSGPNEADAVNTMRAWIVARDQCEARLSRKASAAARQYQSRSGSSSSDASGFVFLVIVLIFILIGSVFSGGKNKNRRHYSGYDSGYSSWYDDDDDDWDSGWDSDWDSSDTDWDSDW